MEMGNLIRSTSSLLGCTASINNSPQHLNKNYLLHGMLFRLNCLATLLITKDGSDVAAVRLASHPYDVGFGQFFIR